jgi:hypothetical protein
MDIDGLINKKPPRVLYHYTSQEGLLGIIGKKEIWATKALYLNDSKEFMYAIDLVNKVLNYPRYSGPKIDELRERLNLIKGVNVCVTSFTKNGDLLSQWRGYGVRGVGYSLGLYGDELKKLADENQFILCPVIYNTDQQEFLVREIIKRWISGQHQFNGLTPMKGFDTEFEDYFAMLAPILKDPSFKEEGEWRLISPILSNDLERYSYRAGRYSLIPYYRFPLEAPTIKFKLAKIVVGPGPMQELSDTAVKSYLTSLNLKYVDPKKVEPSTIPYRGW